MDFDGRPRDYTSKVAVSTSPGQKDGLVGTRLKVMGIRPLASPPILLTYTRWHSSGTTSCTRHNTITAALRLVHLS